MQRGSFGSKQTTRTCRAHDCTLSREGELHGESAGLASAACEPAAARRVGRSVVELEVVIQGRFVGLREFLAAHFDVRSGLDLLPGH